MKTFLKFFIFLLLFSFTLGTQAQINVSGTITFKDNGDPVIGASILEKGTQNGTVTDSRGKYSLSVRSEKSVLVISYLAMKTEEILVGAQREINIKMVPFEEIVMEEIEVADGINDDRQAREEVIMQYSPKVKKAEYSGGLFLDASPAPPAYNTESYSLINENEFRKVTDEPLSTFSIDVDRASYANVRRFLTTNQLPPKDAIRVEELINYFHYDYPQPKGDDPFAIITEVTQAPWNSQNHLVQIALQGKHLDMSQAPNSNLVFLLDVSGSMNSPSKLPLLKKAFHMLVDNLRENDRVAIVVYAGAAGEVLPSTSGSNKAKIREAIDRLNAGGSTAGGAGIKLAYKIAAQNFIKGGNNRVILATDGDFNVGASSDAEMTRLIEDKRNDGVFLTVLGFGTGNYKDSKMESLADKGNGNYAYIDNLLEAKKVLVNEMSGTLFTIAKDVKLQIEFNPAYVQAYRLIGYENRMLNKEDFNDDTKDAGELGAGHTVTALYEVIPAGADANLASVDPLKYQSTGISQGARKSGEMMTVKFRYKEPEGTKSRLIETVINNRITPINQTSDNLRFASSVAEFGMLLRDSKFKSDSSFDSLIERAKGAKGADTEGYRAEFIRLAETAQLIAQ